MASAVGSLPDNLTTEQVIDLIFKDPAVKHGLTEFDDLGKKPHQVLTIYPVVVATGKAKGETRYYLKCLKRQQDIQVYSEKKSCSEEIVRQLWLHKLHHVYQYPWDHIDVEFANFERLDQRRLEAMNREYANDGDDILEDLSQSMSRGTDGSERISDRYEIITQFLFDGVALKPHPNLDPMRNFTFEERLILYRRANGQCQLGCNGKVCGREIEFEDSVVDHVTPHSRGGTTTLPNGRLAHRSCNISRGVRDDFNPDTECCLLEQAEPDKQEAQV